MQTCKTGPFRFNRLKSCWCGVFLLIAEQYRTDCRVRAYERTLVALYTFCPIPPRQIRGDTALFVSAGSQRKRAVGSVHKFAYRQAVALPDGSWALKFPR